MNTSLFKNVINKMCLQTICVCISICVHKQDLVLNNLQGLICHKTQINKPTKHYPKFNKALCIFFLCLRLETASYLLLQKPHNAQFLFQTQPTTFGYSALYAFVINSPLHFSCFFVSIFLFPYLNKVKYCLRNWQ